MRLAHISDFHFDGALERLEDLEEELDRVKGRAPDVVLMTGDLSATGAQDEFETVVEALGRLAPIPVVVLPGNRDIPELYTALDYSRQDEDDDTERKSAIKLELRTLRHQGDGGIVAPRPDGRVLYTRLFGAANVLYHAPGITIVGLCTLRKVSPQVLAQAADALAAAPPGDLLILAAHNPFIPVPNRPLEPGDFAKNAGDVLAMALQHGVHVICTGHFHRSHTVALEWGDAGRTVLSMAPTLTLSTPKKDRGFHLLEFDGDVVVPTAVRTEGVPAARGTGSRQ